MYPQYRLGDITTDFLCAVVRVQTLASILVRIEFMCAAYSSFIGAISQYYELRRYEWLPDVEDYATVGKALILYRHGVARRCEVVYADSDLKCIEVLLIDDGVNTYCTPEDLFLPDPFALVLPAQTFECAIFGLERVSEVLTSDMAAIETLESIVLREPGARIDLDVDDFLVERACDGRVLFTARVVRQHPDIPRIRLYDDRFGGMDLIEYVIRTQELDIPYDDGASDEGIVIQSDDE